MLNTFPSLLDFSAYAPFILRVVVSLWFINHSSKALKNKEQSVFISISEMIGGFLLLGGIYTQIASLILIFTLAINDFKNKEKKESSDSKMVRFFLLVILVSLLFTGAGAYSFDLPL